VCVYKHTQHTHTHTHTHTRAQTYDLVPFASQRFVVAQVVS
jgi:hypothetical protein